MYRLRKHGLFIVFLFLVAAAHSEFPEHIRLTDNNSNDVVISAYGRQSVQPHDMSEEDTPTSGSVQTELVPARILQEFRFFPSLAEPFQLSGQDRLLLWSTQRT